MDNRNELLANINAMLDDMGLKQLSKLGLTKKAEIEIIGMPEVIDENPFFVLLNFPIRLPSGQKTFHRLIFYRGQSVVALCIVNYTLLAVAKEARLGCLNSWCHNFPRSFYTPFDREAVRERIGTLQMDEPIAGLLLKEFGKNFLKAVGKIKASPLGEMYTDSGISTDTPHYYVVEMDKVPEEVLRDRSTTALNGVKMQFWTYQKLEEEMMRRNCTPDGQTLSALKLLEWRRPGVYLRLTSS